MVRCLICFRRFPELKKLYIHYFKSHRKTKIIHKLLKISGLNLNNYLSPRSKKCKQTSEKNIGKNSKKINILNIKDLPTESLVLSENISIFCGDNEIIRIGDNQHSIKLSFENDEHENKEIFCFTLKEIKRQNEQYLPKSEGKYKKGNKKKMKRKKVTKNKTTHNYQMRITKLLKEAQSINPNVIFENGSVDPEPYPKSDLRLLTSDTESCSETSKNSFVPSEETRLFCTKCGSGYKTEHELSEHMYIHEPFCRLCNIWFPDELTFKQHMQLHKIRIFACHVCNAEFPFKEMLFKHFDCHMENRLFEDVLDMEEEYKTFQFNFINNEYNTSLNSILCYLQDRPDMYYYNYKFMKTVCDICYKEVLINEYERHLQIFHSY